MCLYLFTCFNYCHFDLHFQSILLGGQLGRRRHLSPRPFRYLQFPGGATRDPRSSQSLLLLRQGLTQVLRPLCHDILIVPLQEIQLDSVCCWRL